MTTSSSRTLHYSLIAAILLLLLACARMGNPDGGPYDETPPKVVRTTPKFGSANVKSIKKVVIEFDELVKIDNAMEKVVISPPQIEQPEIEAIGKKITVTLLDSLKPNMTYTIDFADAIADNNEGNPYGDYAFTFSTGEEIDTFQVSGNVLDASNLEPIKGMVVGLYKVGDAECDSIYELPDSTFRTVPFERISRTDGSGHFVVKGLSHDKYRIFALKDQNQNFVYDQKAEMIAFSERIIEPSSQPDIRPDTVWHDSIHYDSIVMKPYTHYYPDDIVLLAFESAVQDRHLLKNERLIPQQFTIYFTAKSDTLPKLTGLNFNAEDAFIIESNPTNDTINYWIKDSLVYNIDTLNILIDYFATDTTGLLALTTDTLYLVSKLTKEKIAKQEKEKFEEWAKEYRQKVKAELRAAKKEKKAAEANTGNGDNNTEATEQQAEKPAEERVPESKTETKPSSEKKKKKKSSDDDIEIPPMPEEFLEFKISNAQSLDPDKNIDFTFNEPIDSVDLSKIHFSMKVDTIFEPARFLIKKINGSTMRYRLYAEWEPDSTYQLTVDTAAFVNIYGKRNEGQKRAIKVKSLDAYSTLFVVLHNADSTAIVQLLDGSDKVVKTIKAENNKADFYFINPGTYYMRMFEDNNGNSEWDTGDYDSKQQPEQTYYYPDALTLKAQWEITQDWDPKLKARAKQKPAKITKQKPDKAKSIRNKNEERDRKNSRK